MRWEWNRRIPGSIVACFSGRPAQFRRQVRIAPREKENSSACAATRAISLSHRPLVRRNSSSRRLSRPCARYIHAKGSLFAPGSSSTVLDLSAPGFSLMQVRDGIVEAIGNTPLIKLRARLRADRLHDPGQGRVHEPRPVGEGPRRTRDDPARPRSAATSSPAVWSSRARPATPASGWRWSRTRAAIAP